MALIRPEGKNVPLPDLSSFESPAWFKSAACNGAALNDAKLSDQFFFPVKYTLHGTGEHTEDVKKTKAFCRQCPVMMDCLVWAIDTKENYGIWGGLTPDERRRLKRSDAKRKYPVLRRLA